MKAPVAQDVGGARCERRDESIGDPELAAERHGGGLLHEQRIGAAIDDPAVESIAADYTAEAIGGFEQADVDAAPLQIVRGCKARDASAGDCDIN